MTIIRIVGATLHREAEDLNHQLKGTIVERLLSPLGTRAYYPISGIPGQTGEAQGTSINATLGQAFNDDGHPLVLDCFAQQAKLPIREVFPYPPTHGIKALRELWQREIQRKNPSLDGRISLPVATAGLAGGLTLARELFIGERDEVILYRPYWGNYNLHFQGENGRTNITELSMYKGEGLDLDSLEESLLGSGKKRIICLTFPSNPTGYTPTVSEADQLVSILKDAADRDNALCVITDDAYNGLVYKRGLLIESFFGKLAHAHPNILAVKVDGPTKECFFWGGRVGFLTYGFQAMSEEAAKALEDKTAGRVRGTISGVTTQSQYMVLHGIQDSHFQEQVENQRSILKARAQTIQRTLAQHPEWEEEFKELPFNSGYFMCTQLKKADPEKVRRVLREQYSTGVLSLSDPIYKNLIRIALSAVPERNIPEVYDYLYQACKSSH
ncbi:aminotransferase class I/II-fold pyridoxal phosphate-dependent enzyme [Candidatus Woesearchaeota archaeon]|nr:aminotransferase class I/II-fold pyridoxal phosphate-dependent enzyme [Candidatus Woesearchaeota archaeon]